MAWAHVAGAVPTELQISDADPNYLGFIEFGIPTGDADITGYMNYLIDMVPGTQEENVLGQESFQRSPNDFGDLDDAVLVLPRVSYDDVDTDTVSIDLGASGYLYLMAKYDGPNCGTAAWYVGGLSGPVDIPAQGPQDKYGISGHALFNGASVPDGGMTIVLLAVGLSALGGASWRRRRP
jgi:hypothetical protein